MSRIVRYGLVIAVLFFVAACGGTDSESADTADQTRTDSASEDSTTEDSAPPAAAEPEELADEADPAEAASAEQPADSDPQPVPVRASAEQSVAQAAVAAERTPVSYNGDFATSIAPIFESKCASCHNAGGPGAPHWRLESAADIVSSHQWIAGAIQTGYMPPWPAGGTSPLFHDDRSLASDEVEAILAWSVDGAPLDVEPTTAIAAPVFASLDGDIEIPPHETYQGSTEVADDYRCLIYDFDNTEPQWMQGFEFVPDQTQVVHHAVGYLIPASKRERADRLNEADEAGGWSCYGGAGLGRDELFMGWAPGQAPTKYPEGSGRLIEPGDFMVVQIHYHYDTSAPEDASTMVVDWSDAGGLDKITYGEYLGPAEIPCMSSESGPLCERSAALARARERFGLEGALADAINARCGARPSDFASMTDGIASSECTLPATTFGEIVAVFGHQHEIGKSFKMTLNEGRADEKVLLDIPVWSFDWQLNYEPVESIMIEPGDNISLECTWDRALRDPRLEPSYVLWADGTNDEMCFAAIATREVEGVAAETDLGLNQEFLAFPRPITDCMTQAGIENLPFPERDQVDAAVDALFGCASEEDAGAAFADLLAANFGGLIPENNLACLSERMGTPEGARDVFTFYLDDSTEAERTPVAQMVGQCVVLSEALANFGFPLPEEVQPCVNEAGAALLEKATISGNLPDEAAIFGVLNPCLAGG
jgi:cytochrome c5